MDFLTKDRKVTCLLAVVSLVPFLLNFLSICHRDKLWPKQRFIFIFSLLFGLNKQGKLFYPNTDSKVLFVLTHAGLLELFAVSNVFLHVLLK